MRRQGNAIPHAIFPALHVLAALACVPAGVSAHVSLEWRTPDGCPSATEAESEVERLLQAPLSTLESHVSTRVEITRLATGFEARVTTHSGADAHQLTLQDPSCLALTRAAALVVALALDQTSAAPGAPPKRSRAGPGRTPALPVSEASQPGAPPEAAPTVDAPAAPTTASRSEAVALPYEPLPTAAARAADLDAASASERAVKAERAAPASSRAAGPRAFAGAAIGVTGGVVPKLAPSALVNVGLDLGRVRTALRLGYTPAQTALLDSPTGRVGCGISLAQVALEAGIRAHAGRVTLPFFAGVEGGVFGAHSVGPLLQHASRTAAWFAGYFGSGLAFAWLEHLIVTLHVEALLALRRPSFALEDELAVAHVVHRPELLNIRTYLALEVQFP